MSIKIIKEEFRYIFYAFILLFVVGIFITLSFLPSTYAEISWFSSQNQSQTWFFLFLTRSTVRIMGIVLAIVYCALLLLPILRLPYFRNHFNREPKQALFFQILVFLAVLAVPSFSPRGAEFWEKFILFKGSALYGMVDPIFKHDISFYLLKLPFYNDLLQIHMVILFLIFFLVLILFIIPIFQDFVNDPMELLRQTAWRSNKVLFRVSIVFSALMLCFAMYFYLQPFNLLIEGTSAKVSGLSFIDMHGRIPASKIMFVISLLTAIAVPTVIVLSKRKLLFSISIIYVSSFVIICNIYPSVLKLLKVNPNELEAEKPFIANSISFTREAYGLSDIKQISFDADKRLNAKDIADNQDIINNIRLWDYRAIHDTFKQLQEIRQYYDFVDIDVDRYDTEDGIRSVMLAVREINKQKLPAQAMGWQSLHLQYTHGYGVTMAPTNTFTQDGLPELWMKDFPTKTLKKGLPQLTRPEIYYGEKTNDYIITNISIKEIDYPLENDFAETTYSGKGGVLLGSGLRKFLLAWKFDPWKILLSKYIQKDSRILYNRNIYKAVKKLAPFLKFDNDAYPVITKKGDLYWMLDAYTTSKSFPYSAFINRNEIRNFMGATDTSLKDAIDFYRINYIRNSVKVIVNAYTGEIKFYVFDKKDPIILAWAKSLPHLFEDMADFPEDLLAHIRYPETYFTLQSAIYLDYHMDNPRSFYNLEDRWEFPTEMSAGREQMMQPYYIITKLAGSPEPQYILMLPFKPNKRENMISWLAAPCTYDNTADSPYGKLVLYNFPSSRQIYGPMQIEARIDQDPDISKDLSLWNQQGSNVIRGNLLVIPIANSLLYIEPIYLQSTNSPFPELKRIVVADSNSLVMSESLEDGLRQLTSSSTQSKLSVSSSNASPTESNISLPAPMVQARRLLNEIQNAAATGDWQKFGEKMEKLEQILTSSPPN